MPSGVWDKENNRFWPKNSPEGKRILAAIKKAQSEGAKKQAKKSLQARIQDGSAFAKCHPQLQYYALDLCRACYERKLYIGEEAWAKECEQKANAAKEEADAKIRLEEEAKARLNREPTLEEKMLAMAEAGRKDLLFFGKKILDFELITEEEHRGLCDFLMGPRHSKSVVATSRDSLKTTICSIIYPLWRMARGEVDLRVLLDSHTHATSQKRLKNIQDKLVSSWKFKSCYGNWDGRTKGLTWNDNECSVAVRKDFSAKEHNFETSGIDVEKTGSHYQLIIPDDLHSEKNTKTKDQIENVLTHIKALMPLLSSRDNEVGEMIFVCTFWDDKDAIRTIMNQFKDKISLYIRPAYHFTKEPFDIISTTKQDEFTARGGVLNYPFCLPYTKLLDDRLAMGLDLFSSQYLLDPVSKESALFLESNIQFINRSDVPRNLRRYLICDPAGDPTAKTEDKRDSDNHAMGVLAASSVGNIYLLDLAWGKFSATEAVEHMLRLIKIYRPHMTGIEKAGIGSLATHVKDAVRKKGGYAIVDDLSPAGRSKHSRISWLEPIVTLRKFYIVVDCPFKEEVVYEMTRYTKTGSRAEHDDIIDMIAYLKDMLKKYGTAVVDSAEDEADALEEKLAHLDPVSREHWRKFHQTESREKSLSGMGEF